MAKNQKPLNPRSTFNEFWVMINLGGPRYWKVSSSGIEKTSAPASHQGPVISFDSNSDFRVNLGKKGSAAAAKKYFLTEKQEKCRAFQGRKGIWYGTPAGRITQFDHVLYPGAYYLDDLIDSKQLTFEQDKIVGFNFEEEDFNIIILFGLTVDGDLSEPEVALNPPDLQLTLREYANENGIEDLEPHLFTISDVLSCQAGTGYPIEDMVGGLPIRKLEGGLAAVLATAFLGVVGLSGLNYIQTQSALSAAKQAAVKTEAQKKQTTEYISTNLHKFANTASTKPADMLAFAEIMWNKYSLVTLGKLEKHNGTLKVRIPLQQEIQTSNGAILKRLYDYNEIKNNIDRELPTGLNKAKLNLTVDNNAYEIEYNFTTPGTDLSNITGRK